MWSIGRLSAGAALGIAMLLTAMGPAVAEADVRSGVDVAMALSRASVATGADAVLQPTLSASAPVTLRRATVTFDAADLDGIAVISDETGGLRCTLAAPARLVCPDPNAVWLDPTRRPYGFTVSVRAAPRARPGDSGQITATLTADGIAPVVASATVRVAEGVDLVAVESVTASAAPGAAFDLPLTVSNAGGVAVDGVAVMFDDPRAMPPRGEFSNCRYRDGLLRSCAFAGELRPGVTYRLTVPYRLGRDTLAPSTQYGSARWLTAAEYEDLDGRTDGEPGGGAELTLTPVGAARRVPQVDTARADNATMAVVRVTGRQGTDLAAIGDRVAGAVGATVTATVGLRNNGPATLDFRHEGENTAYTDLTVPPNVTVVRVPDACRRLKDGDVDHDRPYAPGGSAYRCFSGYVLPAGTSDMFAFGLRIDRARRGARGAVTAEKNCRCPRVAVDVDRRNNRADLIVDADADGGTGAVLPITGPTGPPIVAVGLALLVVGGAITGAAVRRGRYDTTRRRG